MDGSTALAKRTKLLAEFQTKPKTQFLLTTFKTAGVGLNLTAATKVLILELWWNDAVEHQAFARVYRPGQTKETECVRILMKGTIDDRMVCCKGQKLERFAQIAMKQSFNK